MTLHELQRALVNAGADRLTCEQCTAAMTLHKHCAGPKARLTSMQAARMLWLVLICQDMAVVCTESLLLKGSGFLPRQHGKTNGNTILQFLAAAIRSTSLAAAVESIEVDASTRLVTVLMRDDDPIEFAAPEVSAYVNAPIGSMTVTGTLMCRLAMAYSSRVWLPIDSHSIEIHDQVQSKQSA